MMTTEQTIHKMNQMKLCNMAEKYQQFASNPQYRNLLLEEGVTYLVDAEYTGRENRKRIRLLQQAHLRYPAHIEEIDYQSRRTLDKSRMLDLSELKWVDHKQNILVHGPTGVGKSYIISALGSKCCEDGISVYYIRTPKLLDEINQSRGTASYLNYLKKLARYQVLIIDDLGIAPLNKKESADFLDIVEDRYQLSSLIISSQFPFENWYRLFSDETIADAICDRLFHNAYKLQISGDSMRKDTTIKTAANDQVKDPVKP